MTDHTWITGRLPTEADADEDGTVDIPYDPGDRPGGGAFQHWSLVVPGQPWWAPNTAKAPQHSPEPSIDLTALTDDELRAHSVAVASELFRRNK
jgi:hypothetical protein